MDTGKWRIDEGLECKVKEKEQPLWNLPHRGLYQRKIQLFYLISKWDSVNGSLNNQQRFSAHITLNLFNKNDQYHLYIFSMPQQTNLSLGRLIVEVSRSHTIRHTHGRARTHTHTHTHTVGLLWTSDQPVAEAATYTTNTTDEHPCPQRDLSPRSQQYSGHRPTR
jgi:hypothetical protein